MFDLARIRREIESLAPEPPYAMDLAIAALADLFRDAGLAPPAEKAWRDLASRGTKPEHRPGQLAALARLAGTTSLGPETVAALRAAPPRDAVAALEDFLEAVWPLSAELVFGNVFRQEELLRRWIATWGGAVAGEDAAESARRLDQLDYRKTLVAYEKAEKARLAEAQKRAEALRKAKEEAEEAARGWRE